MRRDKQPGQTKGEREADDPATAKQKTVAMISRRKFGRGGEDTTMDDYNEEVMIKTPKKKDKFLITEFFSVFAFLFYKKEMTVIN